MPSIFDSLRQIHLDFHTPDFVKVGERFDAVRFFDTLAAAEVNSITVFAHCHHGNSYCDTNVSRRHPGLDFDLLGAMATEAARREIQLLAYFSMNVNEVLAAAHPEYHALDAAGASINSQILQDGTELFWTWLCPNRGPWVRDFLFAHIAEVIEHYPIDGIFVDMAVYLPGSCFCEVCRSQMAAQGLDIDNSDDHERFNSQTIQAIVRELRVFMDKLKPGLRLETGGFNHLGEAAGAEAAISEYYIESLAFQTGWEYFPISARYLRNFALPTVGMTGRFLKNWGDFGTVASLPQLKLQLGLHLMAGVPSAIGDHLPCNGELVPGVYDLIGEAFRFVKARQPWCVGMRPLREAIVIGPAGLTGNAAGMTKGSDSAAVKDAYTSACKLLHELHLQYEVTTAVDDFDLQSAGLVIYGGGPLNDGFVKRLRDFVEAGGLLIAGGQALLDTTPGWRELIGVTSAQESAYDGEFYDVTDGAIADAAIPRMCHYVHAPALDVTFSDDVQPLAAAWRSPCVRSRDAHYGHFHGPATQQAGTAIGVRTVGKGRVVVIRPQLFAAYLQTGYHVHRTVVRRIIDAFLTPERRLLTTNAPGIVDLAIGEKDGYLVLQAQPFVPDRRYRYSFESVNESIAIHDLWVDLAHAAVVTAVRDPLTDQPVDWRQAEGQLRIQLPPLAEHQLYLIASE